MNTLFPPCPNPPSFCQSRGIEVPATKGGSSITWNLSFNVWFFSICLLLLHLGTTYTRNLLNSYDYKSYYYYSLSEHLHQLTPSVPGTIEDFNQKLLNKLIHFYFLFAFLLSYIPLHYYLTKYPSIHVMKQLIYLPFAFLLLHSFPHPPPFCCINPTDAQNIIPNALHFLLVCVYSTFKWSTNKSFDELQPKCECNLFTHRVHSSSFGPCFITKWSDGPDATPWYQIVCWMSFHGYINKHRNKNLHLNLSFSSPTSIINSPISFITPFSIHPFFLLSFLLHELFFCLFRVSRPIRFVIIIQPKIIIFPFKPSFLPSVSPLQSLNLRLCLLLSL